MDDTFIYMKIPFGADFRRFLHDKANLTAARTLLGLPTNLVESLGEAIARYPGFLDRGSLESLFKDYLPEGTQVEQIAGFLSQIDRALAHSDRNLADLVNEIREGSKDSEDIGLKDSEFEELEQSLIVLLGGRLPFDRQRKAERLANATGCRLSDVQIICDLRPIFDEARDRVEGSIVLTTIKLTAIGPDELPISFESRLTERQVSTLADRAQKAIQKIVVLKQHAAAMGVTIPVIDPSSQRASDVVEG